MGFLWGVCGGIITEVFVLNSSNSLFCKITELFLQPISLPIWQLPENDLPQCSDLVECHLADHPWTSLQPSGNYKERQNEKALHFMFSCRPCVCERKNPTSQSLPFQSWVLIFYCSHILTTTCVRVTPKPRAPILFSPSFHDPPANQQNKHAVHAAFHSLFYLQVPNNEVPKFTFVTEIRKIQLK